MANFYSSASFLLIANAYSSSKVYAAKPINGSGDISFTRSTSGSRINSSSLIEQMGSDIIRLDYSLNSCPSFLFETQRTNILNYSNTFNNILWTASATTVTASVIASPSGIIDGWKVNENATTTTHSVRRFSNFGNFVSESTYVYSAFVKPAERTAVAFETNIPPIGYGYTRFDLSGSGSVTFVQPALTASISLISDGWYRISVRGKAASNNLAFYGVNILSGSSSTASYTGEIGKGIYIYGAQIETGSYLTSYIPTPLSATVTRNGDYPLNIPTSSDPYNFTLFHVGTFEANETTAGPSIQITSGSTYIGFYGTTGKASWTGGGVAGSNVSTGSEHKMLVKFQNNSTASWFVDGVKIHSQSISIPNPSWDRIVLNKDITGLPSINEAPARYRIVAVFPSALPDKDCITLTT
jgi:hypothetical protein